MFRRTIAQRSDQEFAKLNCATAPKRTPKNTKSTR